MNFTEMKGRMSDGITHRSIRVDGDGKLVKSPSVTGDVYQIEIPKAGTTSGVADIGGHYKYLLITIPTIDTATLKLQVSLTAGGTYQNLSTVTLPSGTGAYNTTLNLYGWRFFKIVASAAQNTASVAFDVQGVTF